LLTFSFTLRYCIQVGGGDNVTAAAMFVLLNKAGAQNGASFADELPRQTPDRLSKTEK
jgi:hypothetical protein